MNRSSREMTPPIPRSRSPLPHRSRRATSASYLRRGTGTSLVSWSSTAVMRVISPTPQSPPDNYWPLGPLTNWDHNPLGPHITLDPRLPFPDSVGGIFPGPATTQKVYQSIEWFSQLAGLQSLTVLSRLIRGITITLTADWHSGRLAALSPSIMLRNSLRPRV